MRTADIPRNGPSDWRREPREDLNAVVGKLGEELSECATTCFRSMIQGLNERDPDDGRTNIEHLRDEIADVKALIRTAEIRLSLDQDAIEDRAARKLAYKAPWFDVLADSQLRKLIPHSNSEPGEGVEP